MKVKEFIAVLSKFDQDIEVCVEYDGHNMITEEDLIKVEEDKGGKIVVIEYGKVRKSPANQ